jgi:hypothetical protein
MHQQAILSTPADADFMAYRGLVTWSIFTRMSDGSLDLIASSTDLGYAVFAAGIAARKASLFNATSGQFECGTLEQLQRGR